MRILILEDEPIIAIDLEDIVTSGVAGAECVLAANVRIGMQRIDEGVDFALLDVHLGHDGETCWDVAARLSANDIPFCFITSNRRSILKRYEDVPMVDKPFQPVDVTEMVSLAA